MSDTPTFINPPIVELALSAQFSPLLGMTSGHYGRYWVELGKDWTTAFDAPLLADQFETFERRPLPSVGALPLRLEPVPSAGRFLIQHQSQDRLIQVQPTRFVLN